MKILSIEPTPSPNTMKVIVDESLAGGKSNNYKKDDAENAPDKIRQLLQIDGVKGIYHVADFLAVERHPKADWEAVLPEVRSVFGEENESGVQEEKADEHYGEVNVQVLQFKGIPLQIKLLSGDEEKRYGLPDYFAQAMGDAQLEGDNVILQRKWKDFGVRYGDLDKIADEVTDEILASYPSSRVQAIVEAAKEAGDKPVQTRELKKVTVDMLKSCDTWQERYQLLEQIPEPEVDDIPMLNIALEDEKVSVRRLAVVYLGMIEDEQVLSSLYKGLNDKNASVRRTAGDCLSDLGFPAAEEEMMKALSDKNKLVRWRAAMFLYEAGTEKSLKALREAEEDPEFEVKLQIKMAIERIAEGQEAKGSVWKQMTEARKQRMEE
ncbi:conserved virulence factor C family protein [Jeotgalibacillus haloalkalitolerans]|uniref:Conserved virulence factor C family protein n=1 Tax=Jeotgalibacillus haloalkalitolerans TaxID=3104292 RepID=A0ABU5KL10_9BACL|nr:conserved virulence factor C family protein [Jeotgalibacillus sp. HH7-29]MDZ5711952.1 conserved virulence factor C family protein [Jeotgalibacillus sp. HH7-29]